MRMIIYSAGLFGNTGLCTWMVNFLANMHNDYQITVLCQNIAEDFKNVLSKYADCAIYDKQGYYDCDVLLHNYQDNALKPNIHARQTFILLHCDYAKMSHSGAFDGHMRYIAVSEKAAENMRKVYKIDCTAIEPFLLKPNPKKVLRLVSATRLTKEKGFNRMQRLCELLRANNIRFQWLVFSEYSKVLADFPEFINMGKQSNDVVMDYMADAHYVVQLSDHEGWGYSVHEALSVGTPCLVSDIPVFRDAIIDGVNGYRLPLDMKDVDIKKIVLQIPWSFAYDLGIDEVKKKWDEVLNG